MDAFNNSSMGTNIGFGAEFGSIPKFPHGMNGIIVSPYAKIGKNAYIFHQVTIGDDGVDKHNVPTIGDNVTIFAGAKVVGNCHIGDGAKIGANVVVSFDVPSGALVVQERPKVIIKNH
jgi:serine O-acetyltransferase